MRWPKIDLLPAIPRSDLLFAVRTWAASMLALYLSLALQLDSPHWAAMTVWMVALPRPGMVLSKGFHRIVGSIVGAAVGLAMIAVEAQSPGLFIVTLALWVGGCTLASNLLTNFRAYSTVVAGYTAALVALGAVTHPENAFNIAMARASAILIGILCALLMTSLFAPHNSRKEAMGRLREALKRGARRSAYPWDAPHLPRVTMGRELIMDLMDLNTLIEYASAEDAEFREHADQARSLLAHLFGMLSARRSLDAHLIRVGWPGTRLDDIHQDFLNLLAAAPALLDANQEPELIADSKKLRARLSESEPESEVLGAEEMVSSRVVIDRIDDLLHHFIGALEDWAHVQGRRTHTPELRLYFHRDNRLARINALRAALVTLLMGGFWIASAWTDGPTALIFVAVICSAFSAQPRPDRVGWSFFQGACLATVCAFVAKFFLLTIVPTGFAWMAMVFAIFLLPAGLFVTKPATGTLIFGFTAIFFASISPSNTMSYDIVSFLNNAVAILAGVLAGTLAYVLIFPPDPAAARRYVAYRIRRGLEIISQRKPVPPVVLWSTRMYDRITRLYDPANPSGTSTEAVLENGLGALTMGNEVLRLRGFAGTGRLGRPQVQNVQRVMNAFGHFDEDPVAARQAVSDAITSLRDAGFTAAVAERRDEARVLGALEEMKYQFETHPGFLLHENSGWLSEGPSC